jgi:hypothetical protein
MMSMRLTALVPFLTLVLLARETARLDEIVRAARVGGPRREG